MNTVRIWNGSCRRGREAGRNSGGLWNSIPDIRSLRAYMSATTRTARTRPVGDVLELLFELALVAEGSEIADPVRLNQRTLELLQKTL